MSRQDFADASEPFVRAAGLPVPENFAEIAAAVQEKVRLLSDVPAALEFLLNETYPSEEETVVKVRSNAAALVWLASLPEHFNALPEWSADAAKAAVAAAAAEHGVKAGQLMFPLRVALSGKHGGPDLGAILSLLGRERCMERVRNFVRGQL